MYVISPSEEFNCVQFYQYRHNTDIKQVMRTVLWAVWQESVNLCPTFQKYCLNVLVEACQSTCPVFNFLSKFEKKMLFGLLQEPIEPMSVLNWVWQKPVSPIVLHAPIGTPRSAASVLYGVLMLYRVWQKPASNSAKSPPSEACQSTCPAYNLKNWKKCYLVFYWSLLKHCPC